MVNQTNIGLALATFSSIPQSYGSDALHDHCAWVRFFFTTREVRLGPSFEVE
jgi:hypothetical protein